MKQNRFWLKLIGSVIVLHLILIVLSIIEVMIYSYIINPGKDSAYYEAHASASGPWISAIFGSLLMFYLVRRFVKRFTQRQLTYAVGLLTIYILIDLMLVLAAGYKIQDFASSFVLAALPKIAAILLAYFLYVQGNYQEGMTKQAR